MSVQVRIKQKSLFKKKLGMDEIIRLTNLSYGVCDENYRLIRNEIANHTLIYDEKRLARGIDLSLDGNDILLLLSLPTSLSEIRTFYDVIDLICHELKTKNYIREEENVSIDDKERFIEYDQKASLAGLEDLQEKIEHDYRRFEIFGVYHPVSIGKQEMDEIGCDLEKLEKYLDRIQSIDVYYAAPGVYKINNKLIGIYAIGADIPSVVPTEPYIVLNQIQGIEEWYVMLKEGKTIRYDDFINNLQQKKYFDANHVIALLTEHEIDGLLDKYLVQL